MTVPEIVRRRAERLGAAGERWLAALPETVAGLEGEWGFVAGEPLAGASTGVVLRVRRLDGTAAVLKLEVPDDEFGDGQARTLAAAGGNGYALLLAEDRARRALLLEALGAPLVAAGMPVEAQVDLLGGLLLRCWRVPLPAGVTPEQVADKAVSLAALVARLWPALGRPCSGRVVDLALEYAERRRRASSVGAAVVVHGDPHPGNALRVLTPRPGAVGGHVFVDPDGFVADPAYDAGVVLRDWCTEILAAGRADAVPRARRLCHLVADRVRLDPRAVWEWGFVERVTTGLFLLDLGAPDAARPFLETAELLAA